MAPHTSSRRLAAVLSSVLVLMALVAGCGDDEQAAAPPGARQLTEIRVATTPLGSTLPVHAAELKGIFERNGLRPTFTESNDISTFAPALAQGQYDLVFSVPTVVLVAAGRGIDIQVINRMQQTTPDRPSSGWFTKDPAITSVGQLRGRTVGVPALTGQITDSLVYLLAKNGVAKDQVKFVQVPFAAMADQLRAGRVDAVVAGIPFSTSLIERGFHQHDEVVVAAVRHASGGAVRTAFTALYASTSTYAKEHPAVIRAWRKSLTEAIDYLVTNEAEARMLLQSWLKMPAELAQKAPLPDWTLEITPQDMAPYVTISKVAGSIDKEIDVVPLVWQNGP